MRLNQIKVLDKNELQLIHESSLQLLEEVGIKIDDEKARKLLCEFGAIADNQSHFVRIPNDMVKEQLKLVPDSFKLFGPDGSYSLEINTENTHYATLGAAVKLYDPSKKNQIRKSTLKDNLDNLRLVDKLDNIHCSQIDLWPGDIKYTTIHVRCIYNWIKNSHKPYGHGCFGKLVSEDSIRMTSMIAGGDPEIIKHPRLFGIFNPTSPLHLPKIMTNGLEVFTKYKQPTIIAPEALAGTSAPISIAGLLTQTNAEILSGVILAQLYNPGAPVFYGSVSHTTDMRTGNSAIGAIETSLITSGIAQLAKFYQIPSRAIGAVTDSKLLDMQNGFERFQTLLFAASAGINFITCATTYEATLAGALELTVIDNELIGMVKRAIDGINISNDTIGLDVIKKVATNIDQGATFLGEKHTRLHMKKELFIPEFCDRNRRASWQKLGAKDLLKKAKEKIDALLKDFQEYKVEASLEKELQNYIELVNKRTYEDYVKIEDIGKSNITLPNGKNSSHL
ncbi:MAG: trimethylamine methyltransferase family protein [Candidatus Thorarchaeota archaeon]